MVSDHKPSWWQTIPGALTGAAAFLTAVTGLLIALNQMGMLPRSKDDVPVADQQAGIAETPSKDGMKSSGATSAAALVPATKNVTLADVTYTLLSVETVDRTPETVGLRINVRALNQGPYAMNFWVASFRLIVDGLPRAPTNDLNKVVDGNSADEGVVEFTYPRQAKELGLQIHKGEDTAVVVLKAAGK